MAGQKIQPPRKFDLFLESFSRLEAILDFPRIRGLFDDEDFYCNDGAVPA